VKLKDKNFSIENDDALEMLEYYDSKPTFKMQDMSIDDNKTSGVGNTMKDNYIKNFP